MNTLPQILIIGESKSGKDELAKLLSTHFGYVLASASMIACKLVVFDALKEKYGYTSVEQCHADRRNHIPEWVDIIADFNSEDGAALAREVMAVSDIYTGVRKRFEYDAMIEADLFDVIVYLDAYKRIGTPEVSYVELTADDAMFTVDNNADIKKLSIKAKNIHARAVQILAAKPVPVIEQESSIVTRGELSELADKSPDNTTKETFNAAKAEVVKAEAEKVEKAEAEKAEAEKVNPTAVPAKETTKTTAPTKTTAKAKAQNRPPKAPTKR